MRLKIVVVISTLSRGGAERVVSTLTHEWSRCHDVIMAVFEARRPAYDFVGTIIDLRLPVLGSHVKKAYRAIGARSVSLDRLFRKERPDRIISFMESANFPTIVAATTTGLLDRVCVSVRTNPAAIPLPWRWMVPVFYRIPCRVVVPSEGVRDGLVKIGVPANKVALVPNPLSPQTVGVARRRPPFSGRFVLGVGRLHREKGFDRLLKAFSKVTCSDLNLLIVGEGSELGGLVSLAERLGISNSVHFPGPVSDIGPWYQHAQCLVLTSHHEGWPNVLVEAMANGCPVVSFDCRYGPAEILEGGKSGLLVPQGDIRSLTAAIARVASDRELQRRLSTEGRRRASAFSVEKVAPLWVGCADSGGRGARTAEGSSRESGA